MAIKITVRAPQWKYFFNYISKQLDLVSVEHICLRGRKFGDSDNFLASRPLADALQQVVNLIYRRTKLDSFKIWVNSIYRKPFTVLYNGKVDYLDLTTPFSHWLGVSVDIDFITFEEETGLPRTVLEKALSDAGLFRPFNWEPWHYSLSEEKMERYV